MGETAMTVEGNVGGVLSTELDAAVRVALAWNITGRPANAGSFSERVKAAQGALKSLELRLDAIFNSDEVRAEQKQRLTELRENPRLLRTGIKAVTDRAKGVAKLPRVVHSESEEVPRVVAVTAIYLPAVNGRFSAETFSAFIRELQTREPLTVDELWHLGPFLQFVALELLLNEVQPVLDQMNNPAKAATKGSADGVAAHMASLRALGLTDWVSLIEPLIAFDASLMEDPAHAYEQMDFDSKESYRQRVAFVARHSDHTELEVARAALNLAQEAEHQSFDDPRVRWRMTHVGYYLVDAGFPKLAARVEFHAPWANRFRAFLRSHPDDVYITGIQLISVFFVAAAVLPVVPHGTVLACIGMALLLVLPAMQNAVDLVNNAITAIFDPKQLPKVDCSHGIPADCPTLVTVPTLLLNEGQVRDLVTQLEVRFLANRDPHLHFALLTDMPDSVTKPHDNDFDSLVELAVQLVNQLNARYGPSGDGKFLLLHRNRIFNRRQGVWMGWERKRGKLLDLNKLLAREYDAFPIKAGPMEALDRIRYVLTLDSDTQLPRGVAARMVGAIAHPLNQAIIDPKLRIVTAGYGILQPRIGVTVHSASRSRLAAIYSGQTGFDIYTRAVSDAYQDLYGEGSFTGKGIYEVATLHAVLDHRFPRNALLSHDLIEGAYARAGLATDVELIDDYPSHLSAYNRRKHRWVRGDWQIVQWMFSRVPEESGKRVANPISSISRWKIFDNLRRSLVEPFTLFLFVAGWLGATGGPLYWTLITLVLLFLPTLMQFGFSLTRALIGDGKGGVQEAFSGFTQAMFITLLNLTFLPQQAMLSIDAIVRSLVRRYITGERLLEWETAAQAEAGSRKRTPVDRYLTLTPVVAACIAVLVYFFRANSAAIFVAAPILLLWGMATVVTRWLNAKPREQNLRLSMVDENFLRIHALRIWRYFYQFGGKRHHYLIPDNVEEAGLFEAARVSPTNVGLLLNVRQAACEVGFLTVPEFAALTEKSLATIAKLDKYRGHLYNWYDTESLKPLKPRSVSSVDSGNFVASLYTLHSGALELLKKPLLRRELFTSLETFRQLLSIRKPPDTSRMPAFLPPGAEIREWILWVGNYRTARPEVGIVPDELAESWWMCELDARVDAILALLRDMMPWLCAEHAPLRELPQLGIVQDGYGLTVQGAVGFAEGLLGKLALVTDAPELTGLVEKLAASIPVAVENLNALADSLRGITHESERMAEEMIFGFLAHPVRKLLSIAYDVEAGVLHEACYDMLASEARIATFLAVARGELPQESWFKMGREHAAAFGQHILMSWTGTMFEYLMPAVWMRSYPETLISRTLQAAVRVQMGFARGLRLPWGISESGYGGRDAGGHYHYHAFGVPEVALKFDADAGPVIAPYATFLGLSVDSLESLRNLRRMEAMGWMGEFGLYESADYRADAEREYVPAGHGKAVTAAASPVLVKEWMAHHQGMSLLSIVNLLEGYPMQRWFHANPLVQSTELLLHEMPVRKSVLEARDS